MDIYIAINENTPYLAASLTRTQLFFKDNQDGEDTTILNTLQFLGEPRDTTNMSDFKRVAGTKGEVDH